MRIYGFFPMCTLTEVTTSSVLSCRMQIKEGITLTYAVNPTMPASATCMDSLSSPQATGNCGPYGRECTLPSI
jgi:hypothetical protein